LDKLYGEAEPRRTSGGKAGVDGVKFQDWLSILRWYLTSGGKAGVEGVKFQDWLLIFKTVSHTGREIAARSSKIGFSCLLKLGVAADCGEAGPVVWVMVFFAGHYFLLGAG